MLCILTCALVELLGLVAHWISGHKILVVFFICSGDIVLTRPIHVLRCTALFVLFRVMSVGTKSLLQVTKSLYITSKPSK
jgi:hypothetical protein